MLRLPPDSVLDQLFTQACLTRPDGEPYIEGLRRYSELLVMELQAQVAPKEWKPREEKRPKLSAEERSEIQRRGALNRGRPGTPSP